MTTSADNLISIVVPLYNESAGLRGFYESLFAVIQTLKRPYEIVFCDDGSTDATAQIMRDISEANKHVRLVKLSRNFGKEAALTAGIAQARGSAIITLDGDGQHPVRLLPDFISAWENGAQVVVGIRTNASGKGIMKSAGPKLFYKAINLISGQKIETGSSDYRLITRSVQKAFLLLNENDRVTRSLIDWVGFSRTYIHYKADDRHAGEASYSNRQLIKLAINSFVSSSPRPLYLFGYLGIFITLFSLLTGITILFEQFIFGDPFLWDFSGTALLGIMILFLVGIVLMSQGILSLYISYIHSHSKQRPLYIIDEDGSDLDV